MNHMRYQFYESTAGFTLTEMMVAITIGMIVIASVTGTFTAQTRQNNAEEQISQLHQNVRGAVDMISRDLMQAGYKAPGGSVTGVTYSGSTPTSLTIQADLDANGAIDNTSDVTLEYINYAFDSTNHRITRKLGSGGTANLVADNITAFSVVYYAADGTTTTASASVRKVTISITGQTAKADPSYSSNSGYRTYQLSADITPPNLAL
jgi:prepilin-type N-terminal cleavage/methylation domain-containing protein